MARGAPTAGATHQNFESPRRGAEHFLPLRSATHYLEGICRNKDKKTSFKEFKKSASYGAVQQAGQAAA